MNKHTTEKDLERYKRETWETEESTNMCVEYSELSFFINDD